MQLLFAYLPIVTLIYLMTKKNSLPSYQAIPITALMIYLITLTSFQFDFTHVHAVVIKGFLVAWTPITIIAGAIFLFRTMEATGALKVIQQWLNTISTNPIAQLMIIGWAFQFLIEGASGFGTPAAIAAPILVALGFPAVKIAIFCLIMNSVPVSFGAVGTPTWFGFSVVDLSLVQLTQIGITTALINASAAFFVILAGLSFVIERKQIQQNLFFILLSTLTCVLPYVAIAYVSYEFPALIGGLLGLVMTIVLAKFNIGLQQNDDNSDNTVSTKELIKASFPLWGVVLLLVLTRIPDLGIKGLLQLTEPALALDLGILGTFSLSAAFVFSLKGILATVESWQHSLLYVPSLIPFVVVSLLTFFLYQNKQLKTVTSDTLQQMKLPVIALLAALIFVNLMMMGGDASAVALIGKHLAQLTGENWLFFSPFLGALGSFFSGSATISNLTFAGIQQSIALDLGLNQVNVLALQAVGAALGNMVCINNIVAVASVLALKDVEGYILKKTVIAMLIYGVIAGTIGMLVLSN
jgi:lactate permease